MVVCQTKEDAQVALRGTGHREFGISFVEFVGILCKHAHLELTVATNRVMVQSQNKAFKCLNIWSIH